MKIKVGIFFGGPSREREIAFAGGRTVYDNLNKALFEPIPIFVDSHRNFILLDWQHIYKGTIRDFFPPSDTLPESPHHFQIYQESLGPLREEEESRLLEKVGRRLPPEELPQLINVAFLALHGIYGEDGQIQQQLNELQIPFTGSGVRASQIGIDKALQKELMAGRGFDSPKVMVLQGRDWLEGRAEEHYREAGEKIGFPLVIRPAHQGSSIGVSIIREEGGLEAFREAVDGAFFREVIPVARWRRQSEYDRVDHIRLLTDIRDGLGFPLDAAIGEKQETIYHPEQLLQLLDQEAQEAANTDGEFVLTSHLDEEKVILEEFIDGKEFSCIVIRLEDGSAVGLPPTEIRKQEAVFDYRAKYMPGRSRKVTPIDLPEDQVNAIRSECERLFRELDFQAYARIDGFITADQKIFLNDPNTTSGMLPSSFFFHQAAEIGLNPSQFLTYILRCSLQERCRENPGAAAYRTLLAFLDERIEEVQRDDRKRRRVAIILGGYSFERHISVESGRNVFEKLSSAPEYEAVPVFLTGDAQQYRLHQLPINLLLKDHADDIRDKILHWQPHPLIDLIKAQCSSITQKYASESVIFAPEELSLNQLRERVDAVFIALHGRPGEDGKLQADLEAVGLPYNGSGVASSRVTIDKYRTLQTLRKNGFSVTDQLLARKAHYEHDPEGLYEKIENHFSYPLVAKPVDDGCSSAVQVIDNRQELEAYCRLIFRPEGHEGLEARYVLQLRPKEEFPRKEQALFEALITKDGADRFLEVTVGLLTHYHPDGSLRYEVFEPSEALSSGEVLSLEEKFLAGEGQNITPARLSKDPEAQREIAAQIKADIERAARILKVEGYARIDAFARIYQDHSVETIVLEVNSLPGMTPATCIFHQAALNGYKPHEFINAILDFSFERSRPVLSAAATTGAGADDHLTPGSYNTSPPADTSLEGDSTQAMNPSDNSRDNSSDPGSSLTDWLQGLLQAVAGFLRSGVFLRNLAVLAGFLILLFILVRWALSAYTHHGETLQVHNYIGMKLENAKQKARRRSFSIVVNDSLWIPNRSPGEVIEQTPKPLARVKQGRRIYLVVTRRQPPLRTLPSLVGNYDYEQYKRKLARKEIGARVREKQFNNKLEGNTILYLFHNGRKITDADLRQGVKVPAGDTLEFVITERMTNRVRIPEMTCRRFEEAQFYLESVDLTLGQVFGNVRNQSTAFVYDQEPQQGTMAPKGAAVNLYLRQSRPPGCPEDIDPSELSSRELEPDSLRQN